MKHIISLDSVRRSCDEEVHEEAFSLTTDIPRLREAIQMVNDCRLVIIDPVSAYLSNTDSHKDAQIRGLLSPLAALAENTGVAIILVAHLNKSNGRKAIYRTGGSIAFVAAARAAFSVVKDTKEPERRLFLPTKANLAPSGIGGLAYTIEGVTVQSEDGDVSAPVVRIEPDAVDGCADDYMVEPSGDTDDQDDAAEWLIETLASGALGSTEVFRLGKLQGFSMNIIRRAFKRLGGKPKKEAFDGGWKWGLP